ncbi:MAG: thioredoxin TrxC [Gammaproteobacteria bacterium]|nr:thioredoxin TrxC [Gammaproteobacteria bacterium]
MGDSLHIVCAPCGAVNRIPAARLGESPQCGKCHRSLFSAHPLELTSGNFQTQITRNDVPVLVDFWAPWCGPCKMMAPAFEQAAAQLEPRVRLAKLNTENDQAIAGRFGIRSIPTLVLFRKGRELARQSGALSLRDILRWTESHVHA